MKDKTSPRRFIPGFLLMSLMLLLSAASRGQDRSYTLYFPADNMKNYSMAEVPGTRGYVTAGTQFLTGYNRVHLMVYDGSGGISLSKVYEENGIDLRAVNVNIGRSTVTGNLSAYITCSARVPVSFWPNVQDRTRILEVDISNGNLLAQWEIGTTPSTPNGAQPKYNHMYPRHSIYHGHRIYVCGFNGYYKQSLGFPSSPDYGTAKKIFFLALDLATGTVITPTHGWNFGYDVDPYNYLPSEDYDVAMRLTVVNVNGVDNIHITGSCNVGICDPTSGINTACDGASGGAFQYSSGTLSILATPTTSGVSINNNIRCLTRFTNYDPDGTGEFGVGIMKNTSGAGYFIVSDYFEPDASSPFSLKSEYNGYAVTYVDNNFNPVTTGNRRDFVHDGYSVSEVIPGTRTGQMTLVGLIDEILPGCKGNPPGTSNYNPFLTNIIPSYSTYLQMGEASPDYYWKSYNTKVGTGLASVANSFYYSDVSGGSLSHKLWYTTPAARNADYPYDICLSAPLWQYNASGDLLNLKLIHTNVTGDLPGSECPVTDCAPEWGEANAIKTCASGQTCSNNANFTYDTHDAGASMLDYDVLNIYDCSSGFYRMAGQEEKATQLFSFKMSPNPAGQFIDVSVDNVSGDEQAEISLTGMDGRLIKQLFSGKAATLGATIRLDLPAIASGIYLIEMKVSGNTVAKQKLVIEK
jgi:hypothetical protein